MRKLRYQERKRIRSKLLYEGDFSVFASPAEGPNEVTWTRVLDAPPVSRPALLPGFEIRQFSRKQPMSRGAKVSGLRRGLSNL